MTSPASNSDVVLSSIAEEILKNHTSLMNCQVKGLMHGCRIGQLLLDAKKIVPHGAFLDWVKANTSVTPRMCQYYMQVARDVRLTTLLEHEYEAISHLSLTAAVKLAAQPKSRVEKARKAWAKKISESWTRATQLRKDWVRCVREVRQAFKEETGCGDEEFRQWLVTKADIGEAFAEKIPELLSGEYDDDAWTDAMLADIEAKYGLMEGAAP